jgi:SAM-dependent methyltransferase
MPQDLDPYRTSAREQARVGSLFALMPERGERALDIGARDGFLSRLLAERFTEVVALDLEAPQIDCDGVKCVKGDASQLEFADGSFDLVLCAEVLEHIPTVLLSRVGAEIARVASSVAVIGVPYRQDLRIGKTTCSVCGRVNPPWGHVNSFDESALDDLFSSMKRARTDWVGNVRASTSALSSALLDYARNPYGTYVQDEPCVYCDSSMSPPSNRTPAQRVATRCAVLLDRLQTALAQPHANWIHARYEKASGS